MSPLRCLACQGTLHRRPAVVAPDRMHGVPGRWAVHICDRCGSGTTLPLAAEDELGAFYPVGYAPFEVPTGIAAVAMREMQKARNRRFPLQTMGADETSGTLLDGCGRGDLARSWIDLGWKVVGIEPSAEAAAAARSRGAEVLEGTLSTLALPAEAMDAACFRHSLEHVVDPQRDLRLVHEALRPGGRLAIIVPNWGSWQRRAFGEYWFPLELPRHRTHFTAAGLRLALEASGFTRIVIHPGSPPVTTTWSLQFRLLDRLRTREGVALLSGYAASVPVAVLARAIDWAMRSGDFLHASAERPAR